jgi:hypothetical protein
MLAGSGGYHTVEFMKNSGDYLGKLSLFDVQLSFVIGGRTLLFQSDDK